MNFRYKLISKHFVIQRVYKSMNCPCLRLVEDIMRRRPGGRQQEDGGRGQDVGAEIDLLATSGHPANIEIATGCGLDYVNSFKKFNFQ